MGKRLLLSEVVQLLMSLASFLSLIGHASRSAFWLMLVCGGRHLVVNGYTSGTDSLGAVSCESKTCSEIGIELLRRGVSFNFPTD
jgi:gamma-glutamyltranspeptidase/glutathione hydrolase